MAEQSGKGGAGGTFGSGSGAGHFPEVVRLSDRQLAAYNAADLDAFCRCYAEDVQVLDGNGACTLQGMAAFRERYGRLFRECSDVQARIIGRVVCGETVVEHELWQRRGPDGTLSFGEVLVRYTAREGRIAIAQFF